MISKNKYLNGWHLFSLITIPVSLAVLMVMTTVDLSTARGVSSMIQFSVRCSVPWLYLAFAASSLNILFRRPFSRWLLRNRRYIGICFAAAMGWQLFFILWMLLGHWTYYVEEVYWFQDLVEQVPGYMFLIAMTLTSFEPGRSKLSPREWRLLHKVGIYFIFFVVWRTYWYELYYYNDIQFIDYIYYWTGLTAWGLRVLAWNKKHWLRRTG